jgi:GNAT superfamily N-acetyltransferase
MSALSLRVMTEGDLAGVDELRRLAGWNQRPEDWRLLLELEPEGCFVAELDGELAGTVTTTAYCQAIAWIGMMLVHPKHRRQGIGTRLMGQAIEYLRGRAVRCIRLDATPAGYPLYEKLGFLPEWTLTRCQRPAQDDSGPWPLAAADWQPRERGVPGGRDDSRTRELAAADWDGVEQIDAAAFGARRSGLLRSLARHSVKALVWPAGQPAAGWGLFRGGANADYLGPVTCPSAEGAVALVTGLLGGTGARPVLWDVPDGNEAAKATAQQLGFAPVRSLTRMHLGPDAAGSSPCAQFAIADPAVG